MNTRIGHVRNGRAAAVNRMIVLALLNR